MLVLSRRRTEGIQIGDDIEVVVLEIRGNRVRLGIEAPDHVGIRREELTVKLTPRTANKSRSYADASVAVY